MTDDPGDAGGRAEPSEHELAIAALVGRSSCSTPGRGFGGART